MDTAGAHYMSQRGYLADQLYSHDMPMRTGPWSFTRRPPFNWHTSQTEIAGMSAGTMAPRRGTSTGKEVRLMVQKSVLSMPIGMLSHASKQCLLHSFYLSLVAGA